MILCHTCSKVCTVGYLYRMPAVAAWLPTSREPRLPLPIRPAGDGARRCPEASARSPPPREKGRPWPWECLHVLVCLPLTVKSSDGGPDCECMAKLPPIFTLIACACCCMIAPGGCWAAKEEASAPLVEPCCTGAAGVIALLCPLWLRRPFALATFPLGGGGSGCCVWWC